MATTHLEPKNLGSSLILVAVPRSCAKGLACCLIEISSFGPSKRLSQRQWFVCVRYWAIGAGRIGLVSHVPRLALRFSIQAWAGSCSVAKQANRQRQSAQPKRRGQRKQARGVSFYRSCFMGCPQNAVLRLNRWHSVLAHATRVARPRWILQTRTASVLRKRSWACQMGQLRLEFHQTDGLTTCWTPPAVPAALSQPKPLDAIELRSAGSSFESCKSHDHAGLKPHSQKSLRGAPSKTSRNALQCKDCRRNKGRGSGCWPWRSRLPTGRDRWFLHDWRWWPENHCHWREQP